MPCTRQCHALGRNRSSLEAPVTRVAAVRRSTQFAVGGTFPSTVPGSAASAYGQGLLGALVQQRSPDEIRGRLSGLLMVPRLLLSALATALVTLVVSVHDTRLATALLALLAVGSIIALRGFRRIGRNVQGVRAAREPKARRDALDPGLGNE